MHRAGIGQRGVLLRGDFGDLGERAPLEIKHQCHDAQTCQPEAAREQQGELLCPARRLGVRVALRCDRLLQRFQPRRDGVRVAPGVIRRCRPDLRNGHLCRVQLFLDLEIAIHHRIAVGDGREIRLRPRRRGEQRGGDGYWKKQFWIHPPRSVKRRQFEVKRAAGRVIRKPVIYSSQTPAACASRSEDFP